MVMKSLFSKLFLTLAAILLTACLFGAENNSHQGFLSEDALRKTAAAVVAQNYPNADDVLLDDIIKVAYQADGTSLTWDDTAVKILTDKGREKYRALSLGFNAAYSREEFVFVHILRPDGTRLNIDIAAHQQLATDVSQMGSNIYDPNNKDLQVTLPELEIGDVVRYLTRREVFKPRVPNTFSDYQVLEGPSPILHYSYEVDSPEELPLRQVLVKDRISDNIQTSEERRDGRLIRRWEVSDVPQFFPEPEMPSWYTCVQRLLVSTIDSWEDVSRWYWKLSEPHLVASEAMQAQVAELLQGKSDFQERLHAIFTFVSQNIRYMGITVETEAPGYEPHDAKDTFDRRHGVCRDKAALLTALLRQAGFQAYPVLINAGPRIDQEVPKPFFNHAITAVVMPDGSFQLMDSTNETTRDLFPAYLGNCSYLVATPEGETLHVSPSEPYDRHLAVITTNGHLAADGSLLGECCLQMRGINDNAYRGMLLRRSPAQRRVFFENAVKRLLPGGLLTDITFQPADLADTSIPLTITFGFSAPDILTDDGKTALLTVPCFSEQFGYVLFTMGEANLRQRRFPFETETPCGLKESVSLVIPPEWGQILSLPAYRNQDTPEMRWVRNCTYNGGRLEMDTEYAVKTCLFTPEQYLELKEFLKVLDVEEKKIPILARREPASADQVPEEMKAPEPDVTIDDDISLYVLNPDGTWSCEHTKRVTIGTYKGIKENSELKLSFNPASESITLNFGRVRNGQETKEVSEQEKNLMDASWVTGAPRYPAAKTLVVSFPGVKVGSQIEYRYTVNCRKSPFFSVLKAFQTIAPVKNAFLSVTVPRGHKLQVETFQHGFLPTKGIDTRGTPLAYQNRKDKDTVIHEWRASDLPAWRQEALAAPAYIYSPTVFLSDGNWKDYAILLTQVLQNRMDGSPQIAKLANSLRALNDIKALRNHLARAVLEAGPNLEGMPLDALSNASRTLADGYGNSLDRAILTANILRLAGYKPEIALVSDIRLPEMQEFWRKHPLRGIFTRAVVKVKASDGWVWLGDQNQYGELGTSAYEGCLAYNLATRDIETITVRAEYRDKQDTLLIITLHGDNSATLEFTKTVSGHDYMVYRQFYEEMLPEQRDRHFQSILSEISHSATAASEFVTDFQHYPGKIYYKVEVPDYVIDEGGFAHFELPVNLASDFPISGNSRETPLYWGTSLSQVKEIRLRFATANQKLLLAPQDYSWTSPGKRSKVSISRLSTSSPLESRFLLKLERNPEIIMPSDYPQVLDMKQSLGNPAARTILIKR